VGIISKLFGRRSGTANGHPSGRKAIRTTVDRPFRISQPRIGFLNLQGSQGAALAEADQRILAPLFQSSQTSADAVPGCEVLFVYCVLDPRGKVVGSELGIRELIKKAGAYIGVVASGNDPDSCINAMHGRNDWNANTVLIIDRKDDKTPTFFMRLFEAMFNEKSMLTAWIELAPQIPGHDHPDAPGSIMAAEAGHLVFSRQTTPS